MDPRASNVDVVAKAFYLLEFANTVILFEGSSPCETSSCGPYASVTCIPVHHQYRSKKERVERSLS